MPAETKFPLGVLLTTPGARDALTESDIADALYRHSRGDWGDVCEEDKAENEFSAPRHLRILSAYVAENGTRFWVITEADRSATTILLPDEY